MRMDALVAGITARTLPTLATPPRGCSHMHLDPVLLDLGPRIRAHRHQVAAADARRGALLVAVRGHLSGTLWVTPERLPSNVMMTVRGAIVLRMLFRGESRWPQIAGMGPIPWLSPSLQASSSCHVPVVPGSI
mgnify:CR=1 FL=1